MEEKLKELEKISTKLEPNETERDQLLKSFFSRINRFHQELDDLPAWNGLKPKNFDEIELGEEHSPEEILKFLDRNVLNSGGNNASGRFLAYISGGGIFTSALAQFMSSSLNLFTGLNFMAPGAVRLENEMIKWISNEVGYPDTTLGNFTSGGSVANLTALIAARDTKKITPDIISKCVVYVSAQTHNCIQKGIKIIGLQTCIVRKVDMDDQFRMDVTSLTSLIEEDIREGLHPFLVVATAGTTETGSVDNIDLIADICSNHDIWLHVDAAYGGFFVLVDELKHKFKGLEKSDSITFDPHKTMFLPFGCGLVIVKNGKHLYDSFNITGCFLKHDEKIDMADFSPFNLSLEMSRPFRGFNLWLPLQLHGIGPFRAALEEKRLLTMYFYQEVQTLGFEAGPKPDLSICLFRYITKNPTHSNAFNELLIDLTRDDGMICISSTIIADIFWLRLAVVSVRAHKTEVDSLLSLLKEKLQVLTDRFRIGKQLSDFELVREAQKKRRDTGNASLVHFARRSSFFF